LACPLFPVCLAGNSRILRDIAEDHLKVTTNEVVSIVNAWTWAHISDAEFVAAAEKLGASHVHAARTLIRKDLEAD